MQTMNNIYKYTVLLAIAAITSVSCQRELDEWPSPQKNVTIELAVSTSRELTRATPTLEEGTINSVRVYAFYNDKLAGHIFRNATASGTPFYMDLELPETGTHNVEFYVIANEATMVDNDNNPISLLENMSKTELETAKFIGLQSTVLPMYTKKTEGINVDNILQTANTADGHNGHYILNQKITFSLERPIAKLSVYAAKVSGAAIDPVISKIEYYAAGTREYNYIFPQTDATLNVIPSRSNNRMLLLSPVTITKELATGSQPADAAVSTSYDAVVLGQYFAEVACGAAAWDTPSVYDNAGVLNVEYSLGQGIKQVQIYLPRLQRNHHIKVCILINAEGQIIINYEVADWIDYTMPNYHFEYPTHSYLRESVPATLEETKAVPSAAATMRETVPFKGYFQMTKPLTDAWTPTLLGLNGSNCDIVVYEVATNTEVTTYPIPASDQWYQIEVHPKSGMSIGDEVKLAISYTATGLSESEFLLINGSTNSYYWPYSGSSVQDANYVIIKMEN